MRKARSLPAPRHPACASLAAPLLAVFHHSLATAEVALATWLAGLLSDLELPDRLPLVD